MGRPRVTIKDIARETGLSITAISLVLNDRPNKISSASRQLIRDTARRLHYAPNPMARSLAGQGTKFIGQIVPDISGAFFSAMVQGADDEAYPRGYSLILASTGNDPKRELEAIASMSARRVDGLMITPSTRMDVGGYRALIRQLELPVVLLDRVGSLDQLPSVSYDHRLGGYLATRHLLDLGHRRIACLAGGGERAPEGDPRVAGYRWALQEAGLAPEPGSVMDGDYRQEGGYAAAQPLVERGFTGVFACNDAMAFGLYKRARELGVGIPGQLSVVGFDDLPFSELADPPLTTVSQPAQQLGRQAVRLLLDRLEHPERSIRSVCFEPRLVVRGSAGPLGTDVCL